MEKIKIMIVEDEIIISKDLELILTKKGYDVVATAISGEEALEKLKRVKPDIILMNVLIKGNMTGIDVTREVNHLYDMPVIYNTAYKDLETYELMKTTKHYGIINPPVKESTLITSIEIALNKYKMEQKLTETRDWLFTILKSVYNGIITTDMKGRVTYINPIAQRLTGLKDELTVGKDINEKLTIINKQNNTKLEISVEEILNYPESLEIAKGAVITSQTGKESIVNISGARIKNNENELIGCVIILNDITEEIYSQKVLRESEQLHRITLNSISDAVFITDDNGDFTYICPNAEVIFGYTENEIRDFGNILSILGENVFSSNELREMGEITNIERQIDNKYGKTFELLVNVKEVSIGKGTILYTCHDVTELKKAEERISRLNRMYFLLSEINEAIVRIRDIRKLFDEVCRISVETGKFRMVWIGIVDYDTYQLEPVTYAGYEQDYLKNIKISIRENIPEGNGPTGIAIRSGRHFVCNDIKNNPNMLLWRDKALERDYNASATFPIWLGKRVIGALKVYSEVSDFFNDEQVNLFDRLGEDISLALTTIEYEKYLEQNKDISNVNKIETEFASDIETTLLKKNMEDNLSEEIKYKSPPSAKSRPTIISKENTIHDIITVNKDFKEQLGYMPEIAQSDLTTMIYGESGTGKELVASAIKNLSRRKNKPFLIVNCAALPDNLLESELFGYMKGAFTGAVNNKIGLFQSADGGTIFLDEIGDISPSMQVKILRTLQQKEFIPLGSVKKMKIDTRFICATNKDLTKMVEEGSFRQDLYYRLNVVSISIPPLRRRLDDIPILVNHFIRLFNGQMGKKINSVTGDVLKILESYDYPGNVRELENIIKHSFIFCKGTQIKSTHLPKYIMESTMQKTPSDKVMNHKDIKEVKPNEPDTLILNSKDETEKKQIMKHLEENKWNISDTAKSLGIHRATLWRKMKKYDIK